MKMIRNGASVAGQRHSNVLISQPEVSDEANFKKHGPACGSNGVADHALPVSRCESVLGTS
ncbi:hypothetical protein O9992_19480 [Vibrio lentus]|nr:hypothetical protein [Vibrio lentus]